MSRIGKLPINLPQDVIVSIDGQKVDVKGPKGYLSRKIHSLVNVIQENNILRVTSRDNTPFSRSIWGLSRSLLNNMVIGVSIGFAKNMEINGIGYRAEMIDDNTLKMVLGFSHPIIFKIPDGIFCSVQKNTVLTLTGIDKELLGQTCAKIRAWRLPEPYKGKGIKFAGEIIRRKVGKTGVK